MQSTNTEQNNIYSFSGSYSIGESFNPQYNMEQQYQPRNQPVYSSNGQWISSQYYPQQTANFIPTGGYTSYGQNPSIFYSSNPPSIPIVRPPNELPNGTQSYSQTPMYPNYPNNNPSQMPNQYSQFHQANAFQNRPYTYQNPSLRMMSPVNPTHNSPLYFPPVQMPTSQSATDLSHGASGDSTQSQCKRKKNALLIIDPKSQQPVHIENVSSDHTLSATTNGNQEKNLTSRSVNEHGTSKEDTKAEEVRTQFRSAVIRSIQSNSSPEKTSRQSSVHDEKEEIKKENIQSKSTVSESPKEDSTSVTVNTNQELILQKPEQLEPVSDSKNDDEDESNDQTNQDNTTNDKQDQIDSQEEIEDENLPSDNSNDISQSQSTKPLSITPSIDSTTSSNTSQSESTTIEKSSSISKRLFYTKQGLLSKRSDPMSLLRPSGLVTIDGVSDIQPLPHPSDNPYVAANPNALDPDTRFLRDVKSILNRLTPTNYDKLLNQLNELELDRYTRLQGMIDIIFGKAIDEPAFCFLYAKVCKHFEKKSVSEPDENGKTVTHVFRQLLLTHCQRSFEDDYRLAINYDERKQEVDAIKDEKLFKEENEKLEEDLFKAKRRNLGNIFFIGELFKLKILTDTIMYDCIDYLLKDKTDEENLECLCRLLTTIGEELDTKTSDKKSDNRKKLEKSYAELKAIVDQQRASARIRFMIQDLMDLRKAKWVARRAALKPTKIEDIHEQERLKREKEERERQDHREQMRYNDGANNPQLYTKSRGSRGSRGSGVKQPSNRTDDERPEKSFNVNLLRQYQNPDKRNPGSMSINLAPQGGVWGKKPTEKKFDSNHSNGGRSVPQSKPSTGAYPGIPVNPMNNRSSRDSMHDNGNLSGSARQTPSDSGVTSPNNTSTTNSRAGSQNVSREHSRNASPASSFSERTPNVNTKVTTTATSALENNIDQSNITFNEETIQTRVRSLAEEYTENYSDINDRPVIEAFDDLRDFCTSNTNQQGIIVRELFLNVLEAKSHARKAIGHLLDVALDKGILSKEGFLSGFTMIIECAPDFAVDIPYVWQYISEIIGRFIVGLSSNMFLLKPIYKSIPKDKLKQFFENMIRSAVEFSSKSHIQQQWQSSNLSLNDLIDSSFDNQYDWLSEEIHLTISTNETHSPHSDFELVKLFKSINGTEIKTSNEEIIAYIRTHFDSNDKYFIRNICLSYFEACLVNRDQSKKIQQDIAEERVEVLKTFIKNELHAETEAIYAIQNFVHKLEHPQKIDQLFFDILYDKVSVSEEAFLQWRDNPDSSENEGYAVMKISTQEFFNWLEEAEDESDDGDDKANS